MAVFLVEFLRSGRRTWGRLVIEPPGNEAQNLTAARQEKTRIFHGNWAGEHHDLRAGRPSRAFEACAGQALAAAQRKSSGADSQAISDG